jgi:hypothetical protein
MVQMASNWATVSSIRDLTVLQNIQDTKTRSPERFVLCTDAHGQVERYGLFALRRITEELQ